MKIVCDACQAKYSISDDKVQGKVFKIRCKKCSNIIVVRGGAGASEPAPPPQQEKDTRVYDYGYEGGDHPPAGDEAVWHVVINQDQVGPMTAVEVQQRFAGGEIDAETYVWREGFSDWLPLSQVDTFSALVASGPAAAAAPRGSGAEAVASMFGGDEGGGMVRSDPGDLFAAASASPARRDDDGGDLFGSKPAAAAAPGSSAAKLRGERNENSVLFSLNNLAQLASDKPAPAPSHGAAPVGLGTAPGTAGGEGSGLIDIRSMASAYLGSPSGGPAKPASAGIGSIDDLPVFGGGGFSEPAVIVPISNRSSNNKLLYALIGSVGLLVVAAVVVVVVLLKGGDNKPPQVAAATPTEKEQPADKAAEPPAAGAASANPAAVKPSEPAGAGTGPAPAQNAASEPRPAEGGNAGASGKDSHASAPPSEPKPAAPPPPAHKSSTSSTVAVASKQPRPSTPKAEPSAPKAESPAKDSGGCDEVSCVLNNYEGACCAKFKKGGGKAAPSGGGSKPAGGGDLPDSLDRSMISEGVAKVKARVMSCGDKSPAKGQVKVSVKVGPDGHVSSVTVKNTPDAGLGNCVAGMMQKATFARTQSGGSFSYPYTF
ncbi:MAG TPA: GYF domain-containing protein [Kofleriaceae bacterium]|nr:GYF domain-containing protein [Kofleriaceae bacterium]